MRGCVAEKSLLRLMQLADWLLMTECVDACATALTPMVSSHTADPDAALQTT